MANDEQYHTIAFRMGIQEYELLRVIAFQNRVSMAKACRAAMKEFCDKYKK